MSSLRPESHVAQQIRREKLRIQNSSQPLHEFPNNNPGQFNNLDLLQVRNVRNANMLDELAVYSSEMPNFSTSSNPMSAPRNALEYQEVQGAAAAEPSNNRLMMNQYGSFPHSSSAIHSSHKEQCELRNLGNWRNSAPAHQGSDWFVTYANNANSVLSAELNNVSANAYNELIDVQCSNASSGREFQKQLGVLQHNPPLYHNALQDIVKSASISAHTSRQDMASLMQQNNNIWVGNATHHEVELQQQSYENQLNPLRFGWTNRAIANSTLSDSTPSQSLSLSLSSNTQQPKASVSQHEQGSASEVSRDCGKSPQETVGLMPSKSTSISYRSVGPLGPFTGYATILKSSRFLKSAQQLLDEICCLSAAKFAKQYDVSKRVSQEGSASTSADTATGVAAAAKGSDLGSSSSMLYNVSKENNRADPGVGSSFGLSSRRPDYQHKKAKLLYMQEEVTRQCKQYHLQMQMVLASFESVAGLGSATPYIPMAMNSVSKHFRCLKNSISDELKLISEALGEAYLSIPSSSSCSKADTTNTMARIRSCSGMDQSFLRNKLSVTGTATTELLEIQHQQQHVWRPQRGLPERAVAILKAWLFEHFLHPYPTDADKHFLASQTGLSRNQVSNWFINARVRVWKPMVEEIHTLETKATGSKGNCVGTSSGAGGDTRQLPRALSNIGMNSIPENQFEGMDMDMGNAEECEWNKEKRSKLECEMSSNSNMDGTMMGFVPYRRGGLGSTVSLTLGLRHGVEGVQVQQQLQEEHLGVGGHMIHDFVMGN